MQSASVMTMTTVILQCLSRVLENAACCSATSQVHGCSRTIHCMRCQILRSVMVNMVYMVKASAVIQDRTNKPIQVYESHLWYSFWRQVHLRCVWRFAVLSRWCIWLHVIHILASPLACEPQRYALHSLIVAFDS